MKKTRIILLVLAALMLTIIALPHYVLAEDDVFDKVLTDGKLVIKSFSIIWFR